MNVFITGAESTGKSTLAKELSRHFGVSYIPEFAREYIGSLNKPYDIKDLETIAQRQISDIARLTCQDLVFFDTGLVITYVWYEVKYNVVPDFLLRAMDELAKGKYLICEPDLPWIDDPLRENPFIREKLNIRYKELISQFGFEFTIISGRGKVRLNQAIKAVENWLIDKPK